MSLVFQRVDAACIPKIAPYFGQRHNRACDSTYLDTFIWSKAYQVEWAISEKTNALQFLMQKEGAYISALPMCQDGDLKAAFEELVSYFNEVLKQPLRIALADQEGVEALGLLKQTDRFCLVEEVDLKDYLYDGEKMRTLSGRKLHKKKNNLNYFKKSYEGRFFYRRLSETDRDAVWKFLDRWREQKGEEVEEHLDYEIEGIHGILKSNSFYQVVMGGVFVDDVLEAFTIGSYNAREDMVVISIEKANPDMRGLYQFINQQYLVHEFPTARLVNREDDLGLSGLRHAKESYCPMDYARKYRLTQIDYPGDGTSL